MRTSDYDFLYVRPDFYLGRFLEMFADEVFKMDFNLVIEGENDTLYQQFLNIIVKDYFNLFSPDISSTNNPGCYSAADGLITHSLYDQFIEMVKYSQMDGLSKHDQQEFEQKYLNISLNSKFKINFCLHVK